MIKGRSEKWFFLLNEVEKIEEEMVVVCEKIRSNFKEIKKKIDKIKMSEE